jgi:hypothetical protein
MPPRVFLYFATFLFVLTPGATFMTHSSKEQEFYEVFMCESSEGIWLASVTPPIPLTSPLHEQLDHLLTSAVILPP